MKLSVSLPQDDVAFLDDYAEREGFASRSAVVHRAVALLRSDQLADAYQDAWESWDRDEDAALWDTTSSDGLED